MNEDEHFDELENMVIHVRRAVIPPGGGVAIPTALIQDERLSASARGFASFMHSHRDGHGTVAQAMRHATRSEALEWFGELIEHGYVHHVEGDTYKLNETPIWV